jgi:DNA polymerase III subunit chi
MTEIYFYHLEQTPLSSILPDLLRRGLERGLRMAVETNAPENLERLSASLWAVDDVGFMPHGYGDDQPDGQPIWLCADTKNSNAAVYRFYVDGALPVELDGLQRALIMIDSNSEEALLSARSEWKKRKAEGHVVSYWRQDENGRWVNLA